MDTLTVKKGDFSHHASKYITAVESKGQTLIITNHGTPSVMITPVPQNKNWNLSQLEVLAVEGDINDPVLPEMTI